MRRQREERVVRAQEEGREVRVAGWGVQGLGRLVLVWTCDMYLYTFERWRDR